MIDKYEYRDHRRDAAMASNQSNGRGYDFSNIDRDVPIFWRVVGAVFRPSSLFALALLGLSVWLLLSYGGV